MNWEAPMQRGPEAIPRAATEVQGLGAGARAVVDQTTGVEAQKPAVHRAAAERFTPAELLPLADRRARAAAPTQVALQVEAETQAEAAEQAQAEA